MKDKTIGTLLLILAVALGLVFPCRAVHEKVRLSRSSRPTRQKSFSRNRLFMEASALSSIVEIMHSDGADLPFCDNDAEMMTSRGSFQFWRNLQVAFAEIHRVLKYGGVAFAWRGFPGHRPRELAASIRTQQREGGFMPDDHVSAGATGMKRIMESLEIQGYRIRIPKPSSRDDMNDGIGIEFHEK